MFNLKQIGMPSCEDVSLLVSQTHDRSLSLGERWKIKFHLTMCKYCSRFEKQLRFLRTAIQKDKK